MSAIGSASPLSELRAIPLLLAGIAAAAALAPTAAARARPSSGAAISIMKNSLFRGGPVATFRITVQNGGDVALHAVEVTDDRTPACSRELGSMAAGTSRTYTCTRRHVTADFTNVVTVVALSPGGQKVSDQDEAAYTFQTTLPFTG